MRDMQPTQTQVNNASRLGRLQLQRELAAQGIDLELAAGTRYISATESAPALAITAWHNPDITTDRAIIDMLGLYYHVDVAQHTLNATNWRRYITLDPVLAAPMLAQMEAYSHARLLAIMQYDTMAGSLDDMSARHTLDLYQYRYTGSPWIVLSSDNPVKNEITFARIAAIDVKHDTDPATGDDMDSYTYWIDVCEILNLATSGATDFENWQGDDHDKPYLVTFSSHEISNDPNDEKLRGAAGYVGCDTDDLIADPWLQAEEMHRYGSGYDDTESGSFATLADAMRAHDIPADLIGEDDYNAATPPYGDQCGETLADGSVCEMAVYPPTAHAQYHLDRAIAAQVAAWNESNIPVADRRDQAPDIAYALLQDYCRIWLELDKTACLPLELRRNFQDGYYVEVRSTIADTEAAIKMLDKKTPFYHDWDNQEQVIEPLYNDIMARLLA